ncbi:MAG: hypothetical protein ACOZB0_03525 [Pseudomonadota bacterium]
MSTHTGFSHRLLPLAIAQLFAVGTAAADITCEITPEYSVIVEGEAVDLTATCTGPLDSVRWEINTIPVTDYIPVAQGAVAKPVNFRTPVGLGASLYQFGLTGTAPGNETVTTPTPAKVYVKASNALAVAAGATNALTPVQGDCGPADGTAQTAMPNSSNLCTAGTPTMAIAGSTGFSWTCSSPNGDTNYDAYCNASRGYQVTLIENDANGSAAFQSPANGIVTAGNAATILANPATGYSPQFETTCGTGGVTNGNTYTTPAVTSACNVTVTFSNAVNGNCGNYTNYYKTLSAMAAGVCQAGTPTSFSANSSTGQYTWTCAGIGTGSPASCSARLHHTVTAVEASASAANGQITSALSQDVPHGTTAQVTATANSGYTSSISGCGGTTSASPFSTGSITAPCQVTVAYNQAVAVTTDPGMGSGLWIPPTAPNVYVVDQTGTGVTISYVPGCINGTVSGSSSWTGCSANNTFTANAYGTGLPTVVEMVPGKTLSIRYRTTATAGTSKKYITLAGFDGGNTGPVRMWLTDNPVTTYDAANTKCKVESSINAAVVTGRTATAFGTTYYCPIDPNKTYYLNITPTGSNIQTRYQIYESNADFLP